LVLREPLAPTAAALAARLRAEESVCVHVRRGDYARNPQALAVHGLCPPEYYAAGIALVAARVSQPVYYVFSDEPDWVRAEFAPGVPFTCIDSNADRPHVELHLMSSCRHFVIANSSFSWWGAWLSGGGTVVAPRQWATAPELNVASRFPRGWLLA
jgi:hypothetical protein